MLRKLGIVAATAALMVIGIAAMPSKAEAWWRGGCCGVHIGVFVPPIVVGPPVYAAPPPVYYEPPPPPGRYWVPPHWEGGYWVPGHRA